MRLKNNSLVVIFLISLFSLSAAKRVSQVSIVFNPDDLRSIVREMITSHLRQQGKSNDSQIHDQLQNLNSAVEKSTELLEEFRGRLEARNGSVECRNVYKQLVENPSSNLVSAGNGTLRQMLRDLDGQIKTAAGGVENLENSLDGRIRSISREGGAAEVSTTALYPLRTTERPLSAEEYLSRLPPAKKGKTLNGSTIEVISAAVPNTHTVTVQIVNYLEAPLHDYCLYLYQGAVFDEAPQAVPAKTQEVFTFKKHPSSGWVPEGVSSYKLDSAVNTLWRQRTNLPATPFGWPHESTGYFNSGSVKTATIHKDGIYAKMTLQPGLKVKVKVEIFRFDS